MVYFFSVVQNYTFFVIKPSVMHLKIEIIEKLLYLCPDKSVNFYHYDYLDD